MLDQVPMKAFTTIGTHHPWVLVFWTAPVPNFTSQCSWVEAGCAENKPSQIKSGNVIEKGCWWVVVTREFQTTWPTQFLDPTLTATPTIYMYTSISINTYKYIIYYIPEVLGCDPKFCDPPQTWSDMVDLIFAIYPAGCVEIVKVVSPRSSWGLKAPSKCSWMYDILIYIICHIIKYN